MTQWLKNPELDEALLRRQDPPLPREFDLPLSAIDVVRARAIFAVLVEKAIAGDRCPQLFEFQQLGIPASPTLMGRLADYGLIRIEVAGQNWRTVWICDGDHLGRHTMKLEPGPMRHPDEPYYVKGPARP